MKLAGISILLLVFAVSGCACLSAKWSPEALQDRSISHPGSQSISSDNSSERNAFVGLHFGIRANFN